MSENDLSGRCSLGKDGWGFWQIEVRGPRGGLVDTIRLRTRDYPEALRSLANYVETGGNRIATRRMTVRDLTSAFYLTHCNDYEKHPRQKMARRIKLINSVCGNVQIPGTSALAAQTLQNCHDAVTEMLASNGKTLNVALENSKLFRRIVKFGANNGLIPPVAITSNLRKLNVENQIYTPFTAEQITKLFEYVNNQDHHPAYPRREKTPPHLRPMAVALHLLYWTGARISSVARLRWYNVDLKEGFIDYRPYYFGKSKRGAIVPINKDTIKYLSSIRELNPFGSHVTGWEFGYRTYAEYFQAVFDKLDMKGKRIHDLRSTRLVGLVAAGATIEQAAALLGNSKTTAERYYNKLHLMPEYLKDIACKADAVIAENKARFEAQQQSSTPDPSKP